VKAASDKSKSVGPHPGQLVSTATVTLLPPSVMRNYGVSGGHIFVFHPDLQLTLICSPQTELSLGTGKKTKNNIKQWCDEDDQLPTRQK
jgi:hypothetical protein